MGKEASLQYVFGVNKSNEFISRKKPIPVINPPQSEEIIDTVPLKKKYQIGQLVFSNNLDSVEKKGCENIKPQMWIDKLKDGTNAPERIISESGVMTTFDDRLARELWEEAWAAYLKAIEPFEEHRQRVRSTHPELAAMEDVGMCIIGG